MSILACLGFIKTTSLVYYMHEIAYNHYKTHKTIFAILKKNRDKEF